MQHWRDLASLLLRHRWDVLVAMALTPVLLWAGGLGAMQLWREGGGPAVYLLTASGLGTGASYCYWLVSEIVPRFVLEYRFRRAYSVSDWQSVKTQVERALARGWGTDDWMASLGQANANLGNFDAALECYEKIEGPLSTRELEYARIFNHSWCLSQLGRLAESSLVFASVDLKAWPEEMDQHVRDHQQRLRGAGPAQTR